MSYRLIRSIKPITGINFNHLRFAIRNLGQNINQTKIVATIGPTSEQMPTLEHVVEAGMRVMRINFSHATYEEADLRAKNIKLCRGVHTRGRGDAFNLRAIMLDTQGPEIRTGMFPDGQKHQFEIGSKVILSNKEEFRMDQSLDRIWISYEGIYTAVTPGCAILLDDGAIELKVESIEPTDLIICTVVNTGILGNKKGVNLPGRSIKLPAMSEKDKADIRWGIVNDIDYIAASFTRKSQDVIAIREYVTSLMKEIHPDGHPAPKIIAKIESTEALENFDEIVNESDGVMVARGDLGVEIPIHTLAQVQKELVRKANELGKPVVVATQMLDSMQKNPRPTRAECTDVANAILDGADCVMLSGESAQGKYPVAAVRMMQSIIAETETWALKQPNITPLKKLVVDNPDEAFAASVSAACAHVKAKCIIVLCHTGATAINISKFKPDVPIVCFVENQKAGRLLQIYRGLHPVAVPMGLVAIDMYETAISTAKSMGFCAVSDTVVVISHEHGTVRTMRVTSVSE